MTFRIGVVGAGTHGERYVRHGARDVPGATVTALCRRSEQPGRALAARHGARYHREADALIADPAVDAVVVCTPPGSHHALARTVLAAGKPLLLEKPMTGTLAEAEDLVARDGGTAPPLCLAQSLRWNPVLRRVGELWPRLGRVHLVRASQRLAPTTLAWQRDAAATVGGSVLLTGVHLFDTVRWLTGREFVAVDSRQRQVRNPVVEDLFVARALLDDGSWAALEVSKFTDSRACWFEAIGERGQLRADYLAGGIWWHGDGDDETWDVSARVPTLPALLADWRDAVRDGTPPPVTAADGLATLRMVDACYRSAREGREVAVATG
ncbi:Gfo/Idh/MocA family oxidoreductase [bacterium]|nr:Gfo/Idh/MocA family oxidoreductase [bacterium]